MDNYDTEEEVVEVEDTQEEVELEEEQEQEDTTDWKSEAEKERARADKAERTIMKAKEKKEVQAQSKDSVVHNLSDSVAILNAKVHEDDIERVERYAKSEGMSIKDALKDPELKAILALREENRNTAVATNTSNSRRGSAKTTAETLVANASQGKLPDSDEDIARLVAAKRKEQ